MEIGPKSCVPRIRTVMQYLYGSGRQQNVVRDTRTVRDGVRRRKGDDAGSERLHRFGNERHPFTGGVVFFGREPFGYRLAPASFS